MEVDDGRLTDEAVIVVSYIPILGRSIRSLGMEIWRAITIFKACCVEDEQGDLCFSSIGEEVARTYGQLGECAYASKPPIYDYQLNN